MFSFKEISKIILQTLMFTSVIIVSMLFISMSIIFTFGSNYYSITMAITISATIMTVSSFLFYNYIASKISKDLNYKGIL
jgi:hypothetical protein